jgi:hypothetical protein
MFGWLERWRRRRGALPAGLRAELEAEGIELLAERLEGEAIYRDYMAAGQRPRSGHHGLTASIALTPQRLVVRGTHSVRLDARPGIVRSAVEDPGRLLLTYDAADLYPTRAGTVELRFATPRAEEIHARLEEWTARRSS